MEDLISVVPVPAKTPRVRVAKGEAVKRSRGRPPKKSKATVKRVLAVAGKESGDENFDIGGFTDLEDSESQAERRPPKPTSVRQGR